MKLNFFQTVFLYFLVYAFLGWVIEVIYHVFTLKKLVNRGFLYGPICPIYGVGAVVLLLLLNITSKDILSIFIVGFFATSVLEYMTGYILEKLFNTKWWDYSDVKYNVNGYISLRFSIIWGLFSVVFMRVIHPVIEYGLYQINNNFLIKFILVAFVIFILDLIYTILSLLELRKLLNDFKESMNLSKPMEGINDLLEKLEQKKINKEKALNNFFKNKLRQENVKYKNRHIKYINHYPNILLKDFKKFLKKQKEKYREILDKK